MLATLSLASRMRRRKLTNKRSSGHECRKRRRSVAAATEAVASTTLRFAAAWRVRRRKPCRSRTRPTRLRAIAAERTSDRVYLRADGGVRYDVVMQVMGALNAGGFSDVALVTDTGHNQE